MANPAVVVVEDDEREGELLVSILKAEHYEVRWAKTALEGRSLVDKRRPDLLILDRTLSDKDGLELCQELRAEPKNAGIPVLFLTGRGSLADRVVGLKMGGDDYLVKPYRPEELIVRVEALLRRVARQGLKPAILTAGPIELNGDTRIAKVDGREIGLTKLEFDLLSAFMERPERVLTRSFLLSHVWGHGPEAEVATNAVNVMVVGLRKKLGKRSSCIEAVQKVGYRFRPPRS